MNKPTIGRVVIYKTTEADREAAAKNYDNKVAELPAVIVNVWNDTCVNLKVLTDGKTELWKTSVVQGDQQGNWNWPVKSE